MLYPSPALSSPYPSASHPSTPPPFYLTSTTLPSYIRLHLHAILLRQFQEPDREDLRGTLESGEGGVVFGMVEYLEGVWETVLEDPPSVGVVAQFLVPKLPPAAPRPARSNGAKPKSKQVRTQRARRVPSADEQAAYKARTEEWQNSRPFQRVLEGRQSLPAWKQKDAFLQALETNRVLVVIGEVRLLARLLARSQRTDPSRPCARLADRFRQDDAAAAVHPRCVASPDRSWFRAASADQPCCFPADHEIAAGRGCSTSIMVTQPRRVSALGVAARVAQERLEDVDKAQGSVGYAIRGERRAGPNTRLMFCTTGVLLRRLSAGGDANLDGVSHVVVDEVHERSVLLARSSHAVDRGRLTMKPRPSSLPAAPSTATSCFSS